ncbi:MAG: Rpp14/Pop5 family protein [Candidatus Woesearchaeota archaeon]
MKIKAILPTLREKKRYIAFKYKAQREVNEASLKTAIASSLLSLTGTLGCAAAGLLFPRPRIIRVSHKSVNQAKAALALVKEVDGSHIIIKSTITSGILQKAAKVNKGGKNGKG